MVISNVVYHHAQTYVCGFDCRGQYRDTEFHVVTRCLIYLMGLGRFRDQV